jgi:predicted membrane protein
VLTDIHYKFYQFHGNLLVAVLFVYFARRAHLGFLIAPLGWLDVGFLVLSLILFVGSRDTLRKYHARLTLLLGTTRRSSQKRRRAS